MPPYEIKNIHKNKKLIYQNRNVNIVGHQSLVVLLLFLAAGLTSQDCDEIYKYKHPIKYNPRIYIADKTNETLFIDGKLDENAWQSAAFSEEFVDIEGELRLDPERKTKVKILWDDQYLYIGARMEEEHLWYTLTERDAIMYHDDDFEVFIDADGNGHNYQEFEINEFNALWDLWMLYPYYIREGRNYIMEWDAKGTKTAVSLSGSANDPSDIDSFWSVEMAIPLKHLGDPTGYWRINFSRVDWLMDIVDGKYVKQKDKQERNWVWSPTGFVNMHKPETWGYLAFEEDFKIPPIEDFKWEMWKLYYAVTAYNKKEGRYPGNGDCFVKAKNIDLKINYVGFDIIGKFQGEEWILNEMALLRKINK